MDPLAERLQTERESLVRNRETAAQLCSPGTRNTTLLLFMFSGGARDLGLRVRRAVSVTGRETQPGGLESERYRERESERT